MNLITLDFETFYDKVYSLTKMSTEAYIRDERFEVIGVSVKVNDQPAVWYSGSMLEIAVWLLQFDIRNNILLAHHVMFDGAILAWHFGTVPAFYLDTLSMARPQHALVAGGSLKALAEFFEVGVKGTEVVKAIGMRLFHFSEEQLAEYGEYCCNDTELCYKIFKRLAVGFPRIELKVIDQLIRMFTEPVLQLDFDVLENHLADVLKKKAEAIELLGTLCDQSQLMSNLQFAKLLISYGVDPPMKVSARTQKLTYAFAKTDEHFKALLEHDDARVQIVVAGRLGLKSTIEETRTVAFMGIAARGPLPIPIAYYAAQGTGRSGGTDRINLQNLPRGGALRRAIKAPPGHAIVVGDSSQIEARIIAWLAEQNDLVEDFTNGVDVYSKFASKLYNREINRKRKIVDSLGVETYPDFTEGFVGKTCILGLGFGLAAHSLQRQLKSAKPPVLLTLEQAVDAVNLHRSVYSMIPKLWRAGDRALMAIYKGEEMRFGPNGLLRTSAEGIHLPNDMIIRYPHLTYVSTGNYPEFAYTKTRREVAIWVQNKMDQSTSFDKLTRIYGAKVIENVVQALARIVVFDQMIEIGGYLKQCSRNESINAS